MGRRARPRSLAARPGEVAYEWDILRGTLRWGSEVERVLGHCAAEGLWTMDEWTALIHPHDFPMVDASLVEALDGEEDGWRGEYRLQRADGAYADVLDRLRILRDARGRAVRVVGVLSAAFPS